MLCATKRARVGSFVRSSVLSVQTLSSFGIWVSCRPGKLLSTTRFFSNMNSPQTHYELTANLTSKHIVCLRVLGVERIPSITRDRAYRKVRRKHHHTITKTQRLANTVVFLNTKYMNPLHPSSLSLCLAFVWRGYCSRCDG